MFFCFDAGLWTEPSTAAWFISMPKQKEENKTKIVQYGRTSYSAIKCLL